MSISPQYFTYYDLLYKDRNVDLEMWHKFASEARGPILDVGCGTGRVLRSLEEGGYSVVGIDSSDEMVVQARKKIRMPHTQVLQADMRDFDLPVRDFDLAMLVHNTFGHCLTTEDQLACLGVIHKHLREGGRIVVDVSYPPDSRTSVDNEGNIQFGREITDENGQPVFWFLSFKTNRIEQIIDCVQFLDRVDEQGRLYRETIRFLLRYVHKQEMELLLKFSGYEVESVFGDYNFAELSEQSQKMIFTARKTIKT